MSHWRVQQWATFARQWYIYDAYMQCPMLSGEVLSTYISGKHKPIYDPGSDVGDHVIVINARHIAAKDNSRYWERFLYRTDTRFGVKVIDETMREVHKRCPTKVLEFETRVHMKSNWVRRYWLNRLHLFSDGIETVPEELRKNINAVIPQVMPVPKRLDEYTKEEFENFPKLFDWPDNFAWRPPKVYQQVDYLAQKELSEKK